MSIVVLEGSNGTGKSTIIKLLNEKYFFNSTKSIPDWYRDITSKARKMDPISQKDIYMKGHRFRYETLPKDYDVIMDRFFYTTVIRLNYDLKISPEETVKEINSIKMHPDLMIYLKTDKKLILKRLQERGDFTFNPEFFDYETEIYEQLCKNNDKMVIVDNNKTKQETVEQIEKELESHKILLKRR